MHASFQIGLLIEFIGFWIKQQPDNKYSDEYEKVELFAMNINKVGEGSGAPHYRIVCLENKPKYGLFICLHGISSSQDCLQILALFNMGSKETRGDKGSPPLKVLAPSKFFSC